MPRLYHSKSKTGCARCRTRRVKCDEVRPVCGGCSKHQVRCHYDRVAPAAASAPPRILAPARTSHVTNVNSASASSPDHDSIASSGHGPAESSQRRYLELRLLHVYMSEICPQLPGTHLPALEALWSKDVPKLALENEPLLNSILALSCFYLIAEGKDPDPELQIARANYLGAAIEAHQTNLSGMTTDNADTACFVSVLLAVDSFANLMIRPLSPYEPPFHWLQMSRGLGGVFREATSLLRNDAHAKMRPLLADRSYVHQSVVFDRSNLRGLEHLVAFNESEFQDDEDAEAYEKVAFFIGSVIQARRAGENPRMITRRLTSFWVLAPGRYVELLQLQRPRALVLLAYFFGLASWVDNFWWIGRSPSREIKAIKSHLGAEWQESLSWPLEQLTRQPFRGQEEIGNASEESPGY
ncbi:Ff.00g042280.m01.CDS01 [Fusarium sp. VM40]|nr:Ff.00g042280.m01.CDS01 [Fusarium sp. VM40]